MPSDQQDLIAPAVEVSAISDAELQKPAVAKFLYKQIVEMKQAQQKLTLSLELERVRREQLATQLSQVDSRRQVLEERLSGLGNRSAISQLIWGSMAFALAAAIDSIKSGNWIALSLLSVAIIGLGIAVYLVNRTSKVA